VTQPTILFYNLDHARAAVAAATDLNIPITLQSAPGAAAYAGVGFLKAVVDEAGVSDAVIDCGTDAGTAMAALRAGWTRLVFSGDEAMTAKLTDMASQVGATVGASGAGALDLLDVADPSEACRKFLSQD
jgi:fructose/tagatose bisphosphate aldolase